MNTVCLLHYHHVQRFDARWMADLRFSVWSNRRSCTSQTSAASRCVSSERLPLTHDS
jgi:hypothetical protein